MSSSPDQFLELLQPELAPLTRFVRSMVQNDTETEDVVQQTILKAFEHRAQHRPDASFRAWLIAIALNEFRQSRRRERKYQFVMWSEELLERLPGKDDWMTPSLWCERYESVKRVRGVMASLPEKSRAVIQLHDFEGLGLADAARRLSLSFDATRSLYYRARRILKARLSEATRLRLRPHSRRGHTPDST